jgi:molybdenum cofactor cytidylyltransferase
VRLLELSPPDSPAPPRGVLAHDVRDPHQPSRVLARKGSLLGHAELAELLARGAHDLHVLVPDEGDLTEDEAATALGHIVAGPGVAVGSTHYGQVNFTSARRGFFRIDERAVDDINAQDGVLLFTAGPNCPVDVGAALGGVKCAPLLLGQEVVEAVRGIGAALEVVPFRPMRVAFVAPTARLRGGAFEQARTSLSSSLAWYGSSLDVVPETEATVEGVAAALHTAARSGAGLVLAAGASATDPSDLLFEGVRAAGGEVDQIGVPAEPGTACWIGHLQEGLPILGLASCELFGKPGALDLLLPRILSGQPLNRRLVRSLGRGGLVVGGPSRLAPYHATGRA